jgi:hypothetical protein
MPLAGSKNTTQLRRRDSHALPAVVVRLADERPKTGRTPDKQLRVALGARSCRNAADSSRRQPDPHCCQSCAHHATAPQEASG